MRDLQDIYNEIQENKKGVKGIRKEYKEMLANANEYEETVTKLKELRDKKNQIEGMTQERMGNRWDEYEKFKAKIEELNQLLTDVAMSTLMEGKTIALKDQYDNSYEPVYKITFKKVE
jgi:predicted nuclease with TOPRIM domain